MVHISPASQSNFKTTSAIPFLFPSLFFFLIFTPSPPPAPLIILPSHHTHTHTPDGPEGDFLSDEQLRAMGYGQPEGGEGDEGEGEEGEHWDEGYDEEL